VSCFFFFAAIIFFFFCTCALGERAPTLRGCIQSPRASAQRIYTNKISLIHEVCVSSLLISTAICCTIRCVRVTQVESVTSASFTFSSFSSLCMINWILEVRKGSWPDARARYSTRGERRARWHGEVWRYGLEMMKREGESCVCDESGEW